MVFRTVVTSFVLLGLVSAAPSLAEARLMRRRRTVISFSSGRTLSECAQSGQQLEFPQWNCNFHDGHLERAIFEFLGKLPAVRPETFDTPSGDEGGRNISEFRMVGLNTLRPFGPFLTFCRNGSKVVQFDLVNDEPLRIIGAFTPTEDAKPHNIETKALLVRLTSQFRVEGAGENVKLHPKRNLPVSLVGISVVVEGLDEDTNEEITASLSLSKPGFLSTMWDGLLLYVLEKVFNEILKT